MRNCDTRKATIIKRGARPIGHNLIAVKPSMIERKNLSERSGAALGHGLRAGFVREGQANQACATCFDKVATRVSFFNCLFHLVSEKFRYVSAAKSANLPS